MLGISSDQAFSFICSCVAITKSRTTRMLRVPVRDEACPGPSVL